MKRRNESWLIAGITASVAGAALVATAAVGHAGSPVHRYRPACEGAVIVMEAGEELGCDPQRGQRLDMWLDGPWGPASLEACRDGGGEPGEAPGGRIVCQGVDFG